MVSSHNSISHFLAFESSFLIYLSLFVINHLSAHLYLTVDSVDISGLATKGQDFSGLERWVTSYYISYSEDGFKYIEYEEGGQRKVS